MIELNLKPLWPVLLLSAAVATLPVAAYGQDTPRTPDAEDSPRLDQYVLDVFTTDDGLPSGGIRAIAQTPDGYLWFGTQSGLARFDGVTFTTFNAGNMPALLNSDILSLAVTEDGSLWIAARDGGLVRYRGGYATRYAADEGLPPGMVTAMSPGREGTLWIGLASDSRPGWADDSLYRFAGERFDAVVMPGVGAPRGILSIHEDESGAVWIAGGLTGVHRYHEGQWDLFGITEVFDGRRIFAVGTDDAGAIWASGQSGIYRYSGEQFTEVELPPLAPAPTEQGTYFVDTIQGPNGRPWFAGSQGVIRLGPNGTEFFGEDSGLPHYQVNSLFVDRSGSVWVGTKDGLVRLKEGPLLTYTDPLGGGPTHSLIQTRDGTLLTAGISGLSRFHEGRFEPVTLDPAIRGTYVWSLAEDSDGSLWLGTREGLIHMDGAATRVYTTEDGLPRNSCVAFTDPEVDLWFSCAPHGLGRMVDGRFDLIDGSDGAVDALHRDHTGLLWIASAFGGVLRWDGQQMLPFLIDGVPWNPTAQQFYEDTDGTLWVPTTGNGLWRIRGQTATNYTHTDGLLTDSPQAIVEDDHGTFWFSSAEGIFSVRRRDFDDLDAGRIASLPKERYTRSPGVDRIEAPAAGSPAAIKTTDGRIWFTLAGGTIAVVDPTPAADQPPPTVHIEELHVGNEVFFSTRRVPTNAADAADPQDLRLPLGVRDIEIDYTATHVRSADQVHFRYRLVRHDQDWVDADAHETDAGDRRFVRYSSLPPADYEFRVIASNEAGIWNEDGARISFTVPAYYYETLWFRALLGLTGAALLLLLYSSRTRALRRHAVELKGTVDQRDASLADLDRSHAELDRSHASLETALVEVEGLRKKLEHENVYLREEITATHGFTEIVGTSEGIRRVLSQVEQVAATDTTVLILGETGTGKELIAREIHSRSDRRDHALVRVNCAALPASLIESELFGHEKGAFTGAAAKRQGRFELADGGTLFLDEIGDLSADLQAKLLRVLQEGEFERVGGSKTLKVDVRIITATNRDLTRAIAEGSFREDLFYRLNVFSIALPPLRGRRDDIPLLVWHFAGQMASDAGKRFDAIPAPLMDALVRADWRGNVRELRNVVERAVVLSKGTTLRIDEAFATGALGIGPFEETPAVAAEAPPAEARPGDGTLEDIERNHISSVLEQRGWKVSGRGGAAEALGMKESTLRYRMKKLDIKRPG